MRIHYLQHVPFEGSATIADWARANDHTQTHIRLYEQQPLPHPADFDWLVVMGGPMGVADTQAYPWLAAEHRCISAALEADKGVLGICLGAQLIAAVLGARVYPNPQAEIGWFPVTETSTPDETDYAGFIGGELPVLHWHGDTFELPRGAIQLARSAGCEQQAFVHGDRVIGLQFHLEMKHEHASAIIAESGEELARGGKYIQSAEAILAPGEWFADTNAAMTALLERMSTRIERAIL